MLCALIASPIYVFIWRFKNRHARTIGISFTWTTTLTKFLVRNLVNSYKESNLSSGTWLVWICFVYHNLAQNLLNPLSKLFSFLNLFVKTTFSFFQVVWISNSFCKNLLIKGTIIVEYKSLAFIVFIIFFVDWNIVYYYKQKYSQA